jgi:N-acetyl sugar amidotransferase
MSIQFCKKCIYPSTKPELQFNSQGICQGCISYENRKTIDWQLRESQFKEMLKKAKKKNVKYDCVIPVSGGKDSIFQVIKVLECGYNPLCVTSTTDIFTSIGKENIEVLKKLGVDHFQISTDPVLRKKINKFTLKSVGDISWAEHVTIYTIPTRIALNFNIPYVIWGENPNNDSGGPSWDENSSKLTARWHNEFGGLLGLRTSDLIQEFDEPENKFNLYCYPSDEELLKKKIEGIFLGYFFQWDGNSNYEIAKKNGFLNYEKKELEGSLVNYENLDNAQMRVHDYFKYLKYGYDRVTDWCCWHIRRGRLSRNEALELNKEKSGKYPSSYMGYDLKEILADIDCTITEFNQICDDFTNVEIFKCNNENKPVKTEDGSLILNHPYE